MPFVCFVCFSVYVVREYWTYIMGIVVQKENIVIKKIYWWVPNNTGWFYQFTIFCLYSMMDFPPL